MHWSFTCTWDKILDKLVKVLDISDSILRYFIIKSEEKNAKVETWIFISISRFKIESREWLIFYILLSLKKVNIKFKNEFRICFNACGPFLWMVTFDQPFEMFGDILPIHFHQLMAIGDHLSKLLTSNAFHRMASLLFEWRKWTWLRSTLVEWVKKH